MKNRSFFALLFSGLVFTISSCIDKEPVIPDPSIKHDLVITGMKESLGFEIQNGRVDSVPEGINNLSIIIADEDLEQVYQNNYYGYNYWDLYQSIPDSIWIPALPEGNYTLMAVTLDYYGYYDYYYEDGSNQQYLVEPYYSSPGVIYAGREDFTLTQEDQVVTTEMKNISSRIELKLKDGQSLESANLSIMLEAANSQSYDLLNGQFTPFNSDWPISYYTYFGEYYYYDEYGEHVEQVTETNLYVFPTEITAITFDYWDYYGNNFSQSVSLSESFTLDVGEKVTLVIDIDEILEGAGSGFFDWEEIDWNDQGEISIP